jgi:hypothetical protein
MMAVLRSYESSVTGLQVPSGQWIIIDASILVLLLMQLLVMHKPFSRDPFHYNRVGLIFVGMVLTAMNSLIFGVVPTWVSLLIFLTLVAEEAMGRWSFYQAAHGSFLSA